MKRNLAFKIVIAYETFAAAIEAKAMSERMAVQLESACEAWPFQSLAVEQVRNRAITAAAAADMIIIAARAGVELPDAVKDWIESGLRRRRTSPVALVGLLQADWRTPGEPPPPCGYLQQFAEEGTVDFFCNLSPCQQDALEVRHPFSALDSQMREEDTPEYSSSRGWGLND